MRLKWSMNTTIGAAPVDEPTPPWIKKTAVAITALVLIAWALYFGLVFDDTSGKDSEKGSVETASVVGTASIEEEPTYRPSIEAATATPTTQSPTTLSPTETPPLGECSCKSFNHGEYFCIDTNGFLYDKSYCTNEHYEYSCEAAVYGDLCVFEVFPPTSSPTTATPTAAPSASPTAEPTAPTAEPTQAPTEAPECILTYPDRPDELYFGFPRVLYWSTLDAARSKCAERALCVCYIKESDTRWRLGLQTSAPSSAPTESPTASPTSQMPTSEPSAPTSSPTVTIFGTCTCRQFLYTTGDPLCVPMDPGALQFEETCSDMKTETNCLVDETHWKWELCAFTAT